ncbi:MAG: IS1 family transposase [Alphaproteobacteria bacterium]|nr:IS1 family transposase [Alphaproteobacteria bacterium]
MMLKCFKCGGKNIVKNGQVFGWQRYKCKACGYQFTRNAPAGKPIHIKILSHTLYNAGFSMRRIAEIIGVTAQSVSRWIKKWHTTFTQEIGSVENFYEVDSDNLLKIMDIKRNNKCILMQNNLPSGAEVFIIVKLPSQK